MNASSGLAVPLGRRMKLVVAALVGSLLSAAVISSESPAHGTLETEIVFWDWFLEASTFAVAGENLDQGAGAVADFDTDDVDFDDGAGPLALDIEMAPRTVNVSVPNGGNAGAAANAQLDATATADPVSDSIAIEASGSTSREVSAGGSCNPSAPSCSGAEAEAQGEMEISFRLGSPQPFSFSAEVSASGGQLSDGENAITLSGPGGGDAMALAEPGSPVSTSGILPADFYRLKIALGKDADDLERDNPPSSNASDQGSFQLDLQIGDSPTCPDVPIGFARAQGCFTETEPGSGIFETSETAWVGGFEIQPRPGGKLVLDTDQQSVSEAGTGVDVIFAGFAVPLPAAGLPVNVQSGSIDINQAGTAERLLLKLPVKGQAKVAWTDGGTAASFEAEIDIEKLAAPIGALVSTSSLTSVGEARGKLKAKLVNGQGFVLDAAEVAIGEISLIPSSLRVPRTLTLRNLLLRFEIRDEKPFWTGQAGLRLPLTRGTPLDVTGRVFIFDGSLSGGGLAVDGLAQQLGATPIFLQSISGDLLFAPTFGYDATVGGSLGPRVNGKQLLTLTGTLQGGQAARADCTGGLDPAKLVLSSKLTPLEPLGTAGIAESEMSGRACSHAGAGRAMELTTEVKVAFLDDALAYEASQTGLMAVNADGEGRANLEGAATMKLPGFPDLTGRTIISTKGTAACADLTFVQAGFGYEWGSPQPPSVFQGCDMGPFREVVPARAARRGGAGSSIEVPAGLPHAGFAATGTSGPPRVTVSGPDGFSVSSPADGSALHSENAVIAPVPHENTTYVLVREPTAGVWQVTSTDSTNPLDQVSFAEGLEDANVTGKVAGGKHGAGKLQLRYSLRKIDGQNVSLFETGEGIYQPLGNARRDDGTIEFTPTLSTDRERTIEAEVSQDGLPRELITVARFKAPKLPHLKPPKLKAKRQKTSLKLSWAKVLGAGDYLVEVKSRGKVLYRVLTAKRRLRFSDLPEAGKLRLTAQALSETSPPGPMTKLEI